MNPESLTPVATVQSDFAKEPRGRFDIPPLMVTTGFRFYD